MKKDHSFLFSPKKWLGEGKIKLSMVEEELDFFTRWNLGALDQGGKIPASQEVQIKGMNEIMHNQFLITDLTSSHFNLELENAALGTIIGKGIIKENLIAWEFRHSELGFEGFEFYERQPDGTYLVRAEYATPDQYRTIIQGKIWEKIST
ncbi:MAG: hypothetical protein KR126chlam3_00492 [Chlamydiae bacterium]|nr:hypothetical protein [Chlamydiota bacterium]